MKTELQNPMQHFSSLINYGIAKSISRENAEQRRREQAERDEERRLERAEREERKRQEQAEREERKRQEQAEREERKRQEREQREAERRAKEAENEPAPYRNLIGNYLKTNGLSGASGLHGFSTAVPFHEAHPDFEAEFDSDPSEPIVDTPTVDITLEHSRDKLLDFDLDEFGLGVSDGGVGMSVEPPVMETAQPSAPEPFVPMEGTSYWNQSPDLYFNSVFHSQRHLGEYRNNSWNAW